MIRHLGFVLLIFVAGALTACISQPAMAPSHVSALRSGKLVVEKPTAGIVVLTPGQEGQLAEAGFVGALAGGQFGMYAAEGNAGAVASKKHKLAATVLRPYAHEIDTMDFVQDFRAIGENAAAAVPWLQKSGAQVELSSAPGWLNRNRMEHITQASGVDAVVFMHPSLAFSPDMKTLYLLAIVRVYLRGQDRATLLDGGDLVAGAMLGDTMPAFGTNGVDAIAASERNGEGALVARANVWFANGGGRIKQALGQAEKILTGKLENYLIGRRATSDITKY